MLETMMASSTFVKCGVDGGTDPLRWDNQPFPSDSNSSFSPIKQEVVDTTYEGSGQSDFTELKAMQPFDYAGSLTGVDPCLSNNNNDTNNNNNSREKAINQHLNIYIKPLSPPTPSSRESFCFNASPSDVTSSGSISPPNITQLGPGIKIDFPNNQDEFDDIANIVGISCGMGADSTVPSHDTLENLDLDWTQIDAVPLKPVGGAGDHYESILPTSSGSENSITNVSMSSTHVGQPYLTNIPLALQALASSNKGMRAISLDPRDHPGNTTVNFSNISPILQHKLLTGSSTYNTSCYPPLPIKLEPPYEIKTEQHGYQNVIPDSTWGVDPHRHRPGLDILAGRSKQKQNRPKPRLPGSIGSNGSSGGGGGGGGVPGGGCQGDQGKKMMHHCQICNRGFLNKSNIKVHLRTHTGEKPFGCEHCSKAFRQKAHLLKHMSIHKRISRD